MVFHISHINMNTGNQPSSLSANHWSKGAITDRDGGTERTVHTHCMIEINEMIAPIIL